MVFLLKWGPQNILQVLSQVKVLMIYLMFPFSTHGDNLLFQEHVNYIVHRFAFIIPQICQPPYYPLSFENVACNIPLKTEDPC